MSSDPNDAPERSEDAPKSTPPAAAKDASSGAPQEVSGGVDAATHAAVVAERDRFKEALLRSMADLDNVRKRTRREVDEAKQKARSDLMVELLPVFDNLERAMMYTAAAKDISAIAKGLEMVLRLFEDTLGRLGGKRLRAIGQPFDPAHHEAIQQVHSDDHPPGVVAREEVPGYVLDNRLLRPAMVVVSKGPNPEAPKSESTDAGDKPQGDSGGSA